MDCRNAEITALAAARALSWTGMTTLIFGLSALPLSKSESV
jgi:hypothetical protein